MKCDACPKPLYKTFSSQPTPLHNSFQFQNYTYHYPFSLYMSSNSFSFSFSSSLFLSKFTSSTMHPLTNPFQDSLLFIITSFFFTSFFLLLTLLQWCHHHNHKKLPPGSMGWPYLGETLKLYTQNPNSFFSNRQNRYIYMYKMFVLTMLMFFLNICITLLLYDVCLSWVVHVISYMCILLKHMK